MIRDVGLTLCTFLCGNQDYTIGSTGTVDGSRSSILKHRDWFNYAWVERRHIARNTVDKDKRIRTGWWESTLTTNTERNTLRTRLAITLINTKARNLSLQHYLSIGYRTLSDVVAIDCRYRTGQVLLLLSTVTYYYKLLQAVWVFFQHNSVNMTVLCFHLLWSETNVCHVKYGIGWWCFECEITIDVGNCCVCCTSFYNTRTDDRFSVLIDNRAFDCHANLTLLYSWVSKTWRRTVRCQHLILTQYGHKSKQQWFVKILHSGLF